MRTSQDASVGLRVCKQDRTHERGGGEMGELGQECTWMEALPAVLGVSMAASTRPV